MPTYLVYCGTCDRGSVHFATLEAAEEYMEDHKQHRKGSYGHTSCNVDIYKKLQMIDEK